MISRLIKPASNLLNLTRNMGLKYVAFRFYYEALKRTPLMIFLFPVKLSDKQYLSLKEFRNEHNSFFIDKAFFAGQTQLQQSKKIKLSSDAQRIVDGEIPFFSSQWFPLSDWYLNPVNEYRFQNKHWSKLHELRYEQGDIKYVWEKSRFCFLHTLLRDNVHNGKDHSRFIFSLITDWIDKNPLNRGPNYICSQEISLRLLNWLFALYYYRNSEHLTESVFNYILTSIYWQAKHVQKNSSFARMAVRNNHAISEALCLYTVGTLFPSFPESKIWKITGKNRLEEECLFQFADDGSYIQNSHNYHRVAIQLYTFALAIARCNNDQFSEQVKNRLLKSVSFLSAMQDSCTGHLPNYGHNDGSLFFPLNSCSYRDYRPQLAALYASLTNSRLYQSGPWDEDLYWFRLPIKDQNPVLPIKDGIQSFEQGGYYVMRIKNTFAFIRCTSFTQRPAHADNLHLDIFTEGKNIIFDRGSFSYNAAEQILSQYLNSSVHNTVSLCDGEQMLKGPRFTWQNWTKKHGPVNTSITDTMLEFSGAISGFYHIISSGVMHKRIIRYHIIEKTWEVIDKVYNWNGSIRQNWNICDDFEASGFSIICKTENGSNVKGDIREGFYSDTYGVSKKIRQLIFKTDSDTLITLIKQDTIV